MEPVRIPADWESWVDLNPEDGFGIQNLPIGRTTSGEVIVRIGDFALPVLALRDGATLQSEWTSQADLIATQRAIRSQAAEALRVGGDESLRSQLIPVQGLELGLPIKSRGFVDFYAGIHHASNVGRMFRPDQPPLLPNYRHLPIAYNGRASSLIPSGVPVRRPNGQQKIGDDVVFGPTKELDFELELGWVAGRNSALGTPVSIAEADEMILGVVLVNDWSARDVQRWEYQPLGPFLSKSFATSVSPWLVAWDALADVRIPGMPQEPQPHPHLRSVKPDHLDLGLEVSLNGNRICESNASNLYWSIPQQMAHFASNGGNLEAGDLFATGTISGPEEGTFGSMLELSWRGSKPIMLPDGTQRTFLLDGDEVTFTGKAGKVGLGSLINRVVG